MIEQPRRSRLARQESKRVVRQTILIVAGTVLFIVFFLTVGIPSLMKFAVALGDAKSNTKSNQQEDKIPPLAPQINPLAEATASASITIDGYTESDAIVTLKRSGASFTEATADSEGKFQFDEVLLDKGSNTFTFVAKDAAGNESIETSPQTVEYDDEVPKLEIESPSNGAKVFGLLNQMIDVRGTTDSGTQVTLNDRQLVVTGSGTFSTKYSLQEGDNKLVFVATDKAGNQTTVELTVSFSR